MDNSVTFTSNCVRCERPDVAEEMIQCDECKKFYHYSCAGADESCKSTEWSCSSCINTANGNSNSTVEAIQTLTNRLSELIASLPPESSTSVVEPTRVLASQLAKLVPANLSKDEQQSATISPPTPLVTPSELLSARTEVTAIPTTSWPQMSNASSTYVPSSQARVLPPTRFFATSTGTIPKITRSSTLPPMRTQWAPYGYPPAIHRPTPVSTPSMLNVNAPAFRTTRSSSLTESQMRNFRKADILNRMKHICEEENRLMDQFDQEDQQSILWNTPPRSSYVNHCSTPQSVHSISSLPYTSTNTTNSWLNHNVNMVSSGFQSMPSSMANFATHPTNSTFTVPVTSSTINQGQSFDYSAMNMSHMLARQSIKVDLPQFHGRPEEWAMFITTFESTTDACGYTDVENLYRLQKSLKGSARTMVEGLLSNPAFVGQIISTLRTLYGRPDMIINAQIEKIKREPPPKADKLETIVQFSVLVKNLCATIESSGLLDHMSNPILLQELVNRLPPQMKLNWAQHRRYFPKIDIQIFSIWLDETAVDICSVLPHAINLQKSNCDEKPKRSHDVHINFHAESSAPQPSTSVASQSSIPKKIDKCEFCEKPAETCKSLTSCTGFPKLTLSERWKAVRRLKLCCTCLKPHKGKCNFSKDCGINNCEKKHHQVLHNPNKAAEKPAETAIVGLHYNASNILFRIIPVTLRGPKGSIDTFALLDDAAKVTIMESSLAQELGVVGEPAPLRLKWTGNTYRNHDESEFVHLKISPRNSKITFNLHARTVNDAGLPTQTVDMTELTKKHPFLSKLPIQSYKEIKPKILIGLDHMSLSVPRKVVEGKECEPIGTKTLLGWCIGGQITSESYQSLMSSVLFHLCECQPTADSRLDELVRSYYAIESIGVSKKIDYTLTPEEKRSYAIMDQTTVKRGNRYEVGLLWKYESLSLPDSYPMAMSRLRCLEKKLSADPILKLKVQEQFDQYVKDEYVRQLTPEELLKEYPNVWYLPVFPIHNPNKPDRTRLVWDAAAVVDGVSLNHALLKGPDLNASLLDILFRFRERKYAFTADIQQMFHRVLVRDVDQHAQRFLWRDGDPTKTPRTYVMRVMTFGATCSPFQAQYIKNRNADHFQALYPEAVRSIKESHYVDDLLESVDNLEQAITLCKNIKDIHASGGFNIRNWRSNAPEITSTMNEGVPSTSPISIMCPEGNIEKVLGIFWDTDSDCITYSLRYHKTCEDVLGGVRRPTKRESLRTQMSTYDPPGYLAHYLVGLKIIQRETWIQNLGWDDMLTDELYEKWKMWLQHLPTIENLRIPRHYMNGFKTSGSCDLHVFVDAGEKAFAAAAYLRMETPDEVIVTLVSAKTKTAPVKITAIPRLELQSAVLGNRLANTIKSALSITIRRVQYWTDSTTVLDWLNTKKRLVQFVAFRVGEIKENSSVSDWRWIPSKENVADDATKFSDSFKLTSDSRWFQGPPFLKADPSSWPTDTRPQNTEDEVPEILLHQEETQPFIDCNRFSSFRTLLRTAAYVYRYTSNLLAKVRKAPLAKQSLDAHELSKAELLLFRIAQREHFQEEIILLSKSQHLSRKSILYKRSPFLDANNVIRMKARTEFLSHNDVERFPIILPRQHRITMLMIEAVHQRHAHQFNETVVNEVRQRFDIIGLRRLVKKVQRNCMVCKIRNAKPAVPEMSPLPPARLAYDSRPFTYVGVDLFGPLTVTVRRRPEKRWGVVFTCLTVRAIHIELTSSLSADSFILAFRNFTNRRGEPRELYCDRGTNFVGANKILKDILVDIDFDKVVDSTTTPNLQWKFNPPASPHMAGIWERLIRSIKAGLNVMIPPERNPSPDVLQSALIEIEGMINSRPLTYMPLDSENEEALTPNHFLLGDTKGRKTLLQHRTAEPKVLKHQWQMQQQLVQRFRRRWILEYLPTLTRRTKWFDTVPELKEGDIAIIIDENDKRQSWPKGRIVQVVKSRDGHIRKAFIQATINGERRVYERPVAKLAKLDVA